MTRSSPTPNIHCRDRFAILTPLPWPDSSSGQAVVCVDYGIVSDQKDIFLPAIKKAVKENDIVLFSGGSSVGVRDLGEQVVEALGPPGILVHGVTLKPGKPILIGLSGTTPIFGLPGHPVSAMVCFDFFVKPAIRQLSGHQDQSEPSSPIYHGQSCPQY